MSRLDRDRAVLLVVDVQEGFAKAVQGFESVAESAGKLVEGAAIMGVPTVATEQYPKGLGATAPAVAERLPAGVKPLEKVCFSAAEADGFELDGRDQVLICGIESHVCVSQTALDLLERGVEVHVAADATSSRTEANRELGLHRIERAGGIVTSVETALFELLRAAGSDEFKRVQVLVK